MENLKVKVKIEKKEMTIDDLKESMKGNNGRIIAMKEFLVNYDNKWTLQLLDSDTEENSYRVAVPSGMNIYWKEDGEHWFTTQVMGYRGAEIIWQRSEAESINDQYAEIEQVRQDTVKVTIDELKHRVYKKDVSHLDSIDVYRVLELFNVQSHAVGHAIKKLLCSGDRGTKDEAQDIQEAIDSLVRYQEMKNEDQGEDCVSIEW